MVTSNELRAFLIRDQAETESIKAKLLAEAQKTYSVNLKSPSKDFGIWTLRAWDYGEAQQILGHPYFIKASAVLAGKLEWQPTSDELKEWFRFQADMIAKAIIDPPMDGEFIMKLNNFKVLMGLWRFLLQVSGMTDEDLGFLNKFFRKPTGEILGESVDRRNEDDSRPSG
jgi:hypothetical protein